VVNKTLMAIMRADIMQVSSLIENMGNTMGRPEDIKKMRLKTQEMLTSVPLENEDDTIGQLLAILDQATYLCGLLATSGERMI